MLSFLWHSALSAPLYAAAILAFLAGLVVFSKCIRTIFWSPLSKFPGPRFAACSTLFEWYHLIIKNDWLETLEDLHREHGFIVRIGPDELHVSDHSFNLQHHNRSDLTKSPAYYGLLGDLLAGLANPHGHKERKYAIQPLFTGGTLAKFSESTMNTHIESLVDRLALAAENRNTVNLTHVLWAYTNDIMTSYVLGTDFGYLHSGDLQPMHDATRAFSAIDLATVLRSMPVIKQLLDIVPILRRSSPLGWTDKLIGSRLSSIVADSPDSNKSPQNVLTRLWRQLRNKRTVVRELSQVIFIGNEALLSNLTFLLCQMMQNPESITKLRHELDSLDEDAVGSRVWQDPKVLRLPYLDAVYRESLRLSSPGWHRQPRQARQAVEYNGLVIPSMTSVSFTLRMLERDPALYSDPDTFRPDRWLGDSAEVQKAKRSSVTFGTGTRTCLGQSIARHVLCKTVSALISRFDLAFDNQERDAQEGYKYLTTYPSKGREGYFKVKLRLRPSA